MAAIILRHGGPWERGFFLLIVLGTPALVLIVLAIGELIVRWPFEVLMSYVLAVASVGAYRDAFNDPIYSVRVLREAFHRLRLRAHDLQAGEEAYYAELIRYLVAEGDDGAPPGSRRWALLNYAAYCLMLGSAVAFAFAVLPLLGPWTPYAFAGLDAVVAGSFFVAHRRRVRGLLEEAGKRGYRLFAYMREIRRLSGSPLGNSRGP